MRPLAASSGFGIKVSVQRALREGSPRAYFPEHRQHLRLHDVGYLVMELVKGPALADVIKKGRDSPGAQLPGHKPRSLFASYSGSLVMGLNLMLC